MSELKSKRGSTHFDTCFQQHLKVIEGELCYLTDTGLWVKSCHRLGVGAISYEKDIIEINSPKRG